MLLAKKDADAQKWPVQRSAQKLSMQNGGFASWLSEWLSDHRHWQQYVVQGYLKGLRALQERLGTLNDIAVGIALYSAAAPHDTRALFALGWLAAQRERALRACRPDLQRFIELPRFWRGKERKKAAKAARGADKQHP